MRGLHWICSDDLYRLTLSNDWKHSLWWIQPETYWLPLPIWWNGVFLSERFRSSPVAQTIPSLLALLLVLAVTTCPRKSSWPSLLLLASCPMFLDMTTSVLSEPLYLAFSALAIRLFLMLWSSPGRRTSAAMVAVLCAMELTRYEGWVVSALLAGVLILRWRSRLLHRPSALPILVVGVLILAAPPTWWIWLNHTVHGGWLHPFRHASAEALKLSAGARVRYMIDCTVLSAPLLIGFAVFGFALAISRRRWSVLVVGAVFAAPFLQMVITNCIGSVYPDRFGLPLLLGMLPAAAEGARATLTMAKRKLAVMYILLVLLLWMGVCWSTFVSCSRQPLVSPVLQESIAALRSHLAQDDTVLVLDYDSGEPVALRDLQVFRAKFRYGAVLCRSWFKDELPLSDERTAQLRIKFVLHRTTEPGSVFQSATGPIWSIGGGWHCMGIQPSHGRD